MSCSWYLLFGLSEELKNVVSGVQIRDGHFHLHYLQKVSNNVISNGLNKVDELRKEYHLDKIVGVLPQENASLINKLQQNDDYNIYPGLYVLVENFSDEVLENAKKFKFLELSNWLGMPFLLSEELEVVLSKATSEGIKKFQIHTEQLRQKDLNLLKEYITKEDAIFYLVHGLYALYPFTEVDKKEVKELEGNLLLGTSPFSGIIAEIPNERLSCAISDGLENLLVFESDFNLTYLERDPASYKSTIDSIIETIGWNDKILYDNLEIFLR